MGTTRIGTANGFQQHDFGLVAGTDKVLPGDLFGFYYGDSSGGNVGSIEYTEIAGPLTVRLFSDADGIQLGDLYTTPTNTLPRFYSINATTIHATDIVPEPSSLTLIVMGLVGLAFCRWRRRRIEVGRKS